MMLKEPVSDSVVRRLPRYYRYLSELERAGVERTSSQALATQLGSTASQIRQDLNCFGGFGHQGYGYHVSDLRTQLGRIIGLEQCMPAVLIGAGHLGSVIAVNIDFPAYGFYLTGIFDIVPTVCGQVLGGLTVQHMTQLSDFAGRCIQQQQYFVFRNTLHRRLRMIWCIWAFTDFGISVTVI